MQPRPSDLGEARPRRYREAVRQEVARPPPPVGCAPTWAGAELTGYSPIGTKPAALRRRWMLQLVYISTARQAHSDEVLDSILAASRRNNGRQDVTGLLVAG